MKTVSKHLVTLTGLLALKSSLPLASAQSDQIFCDPNARPVFCTPVYSPVCAYSFGCENSLCSYTAINACAACGQSDINYYTFGECFYNSKDVDQFLDEGHEGHAGEGEGNEGHAGEGEGHGHESPEEGHAPETEVSPEEGIVTENEISPEEGNEIEISPEEGNVPETEISPEEGIIPETEISPEEGNVPETEEQLGEQETEEEIEVEQPVEEEEKEEEEVTEEEEEEETTEQSENEEAPGGNPDTSNCPTSGVLVYVNGKFIRGTYCCGAQSSCPSKVSPVCGSLNQCVGSLCRQTKVNSCNACQDSNVKLYFPGTCHQLFGDAEVTLEDDSENTELDTEEEGLNNGGADDDFDFRMLKLDDDWFDIQLN